MESYPKIPPDKNENNLEVFQLGSHDSHLVSSRQLSWGISLFNKLLKISCKILSKETEENFEITLKPTFQKIKVGCFKW